MNIEELNKKSDNSELNWQASEDIGNVGIDNETPPFAKADVTAINAFEGELGIKIPQKIYESLQMYKFGYYFSSRDGFLGTNSESELIDLLVGDTPFLAFGQAGYGFNSSRFELYYVSDKFAYKLDIPFGGAFMDNDQIAEKITEKLAKLPTFIERYNTKVDGQMVTVIFDDGRLEKHISIFDKKTHKFVAPFEEYSHLT